jgi:hypothetical protein
MKAAIFISICLILVSFPGYAQDFEFVGVRKCKLCHEMAKKGDTYWKWLNGPHARAFKTLKAMGEEKNPQCLECHTTGFNAGGYQVDNAGAIGLEGVQCESCHGPGSSYRRMHIMKDKQKSLANGLVEPTETVCIKCHNEKSPTFKGFNYKEAVAKINHRFRK